MTERTLVLEGNFLPQQETTYVHLPFEMPEGATRLEVEYSYSHRIGSDPFLSGGNTIDLGVFDARGIEFLNAGFRGWSGSERAGFIISETEATPGYLAGPLPPGQWNVLLGLYKIASDGCSYRVAITITTETNHRSTLEFPTPIANLPASALQPRNRSWLRGELHCHTLHSDGDSGVSDVIKLARSRGLDFLAITDHNTISTQRELATMHDSGIILIRGVEVTTFQGHLNVWGIGDWVDFRVQNVEQMNAAIHFAVERGAVTACNHPKPFGPPWEFEHARGYHAIEVWNGPWYVMNQMSLDFWSERLARGKRIVAIGGSDYHRVSELEQPPRAPGTPTTWVKLSEAASEFAILHAIRQGRVSLSDEPDGPFLELRADDAEMGEVLARRTCSEVDVRVQCLRGANNRLQVWDERGILFERAVAEAEQVITARLAVKNSLFIRAELRDASDNLRALTNPIYFASS